MGFLFSEDLSFLVPNIPMKGHIRTRQKCPICEEKFTHVPQLGFYCPEHKTIPKKFFFDFWYQGRQIQIYRDKSGRPLESYRQALEIQFKINRELEDHTFDISKYARVEAKKFFVCNLLDRFLSAKLPAIAPSYQATYKIMVKRAEKNFGEADARELRKIDLINYNDTLQGLGIHAKTLKNHLDLFKTFLRWCKNDLEIISECPHFPEVQVQQKPISWVSQEDQIKLFDHVPAGDKPIIAFLMLQGCRPGEARAVKVKDVNLQNQSITIRATFSGRVYREKRKGRGSESVTIPIHHELLPYIAARVKDALPGAWLFPGPVGRNYSENALRRVWGKVKGRAGISGIRLYDATRHSFASQLINAGTDLIQVSRLLGHSDIRTTQKYAHSQLGALRAELSKLSLDKVKTIAQPLQFASETKNKQ